jgi:hypothetical protein
MIYKFLFSLSFVYTQRLKMEYIFQKQHGEITAKDLYLVSTHRNSIAQRITHIIDCKAYMWQKKPFLREISVWERLSNQIKTYHIYIPNRLLFDEYDYSVNYQIRKIHGLPIERRRVDDNFYLYVEVMQILYGMFENADLIGYKGGTIERDMLNKMRVNSINLEVLGCPKYITLLSKYGVVQHDCGYHLRNGVYHCSGHEVELFARFVNDNE